MYTDRTASIAMLSGVVLAILLAAAPAAAQGQGGASSTAAGSDERPPELERQFRRAQMAWRRGASMLEAKARLDRVLRERPGDVEVRKLRAEVLLEMNRSREALEDASRAAEHRPRDGMAHLLRAEAARRDGQIDVARRALECAADRLPEEAAPHTRFSWNAMLLDRLAQAEAFGRVAIALDSTSAPAYRQLARVFVERERPDEAASILVRGLRVAALEPRSIRQDERLRPLADHERLRDLLPQ